MEKTYFAVDIGGTSTKYAILGENGSILSHGEMPTEAEKGGPHIVKRVKALLRKTLEEHSTPFSGVCISTAGIVDEEEGTILHAGPQIPEYKGVQWKKTIEEAFSLPCEVENDVKCAGLGEYSFGSGKGASSMLCLTIGTGIGGSFILNGEVYHGTSHSAMEIGYMQIPGGMFQRMASTSALVKRVASRKGEPEELWNGKRIFEEVAKEDKICLEELDRLCDALSIGLSNLCYAFNPECIVLGGGIMEQKDILLPKIWGHLQEHLVPIVAENTRLLAASLGNRAGLLGAYVHFHNRQKSKA